MPEAPWFPGSTGSRSGVRWQADVASGSPVSSAATSGGVAWAGLLAASTSGVAAAALAASLAWSGVPASSTAGVASAATPASVSWAGLAATSSVGQFTVVTPGGLAWGGLAATSSVATTTAALPGAFTWAGLSASSSSATVSPANPAALTWAGLSGTGVLIGGPLTADARLGSLAWAGVPARVQQVVTLTTWTADLSQQALVQFDSPDAVLHVDPPLAVAPASITERSIRRTSQTWNPLTVDTATGRIQPATLVSEAVGEVGVHHVTVDGLDVTYFRGVPTQIGEYASSEPGGEDYASLTFPQTTSIDAAGSGDLWWLHPDAPVEIFILAPDGLTRLHQFSGHLVSDNTGISDGLRSDWHVRGNIRQPDDIVHKVQTILPPTDIGSLVAKEYNDVVGRRYAPLAPVPTGIMAKDRGSYSDTAGDYAQALLAKSWTTGGDQWTITRNGVNQYAIALKDRTTVHWTVTAGTPGIQHDLTEDVSQQVNCIYGRGVGPDGYAWAGWCHPNLLPDAAPVYPMSPITVLIQTGTTDASTTTGNGVTTWQRRVQSLGYSVTVDGAYGSDDAAVCRQVQTDYGLTVDGKVGPQTWAATFDTGSGGGDLNGSYRRPLAIDPRVDPYLYAANGAIVGDNPLHDPSVIRRERNIDYGVGTAKAEAEVSAQLDLARNADPGWHGDITFKTDPREGSRFLMREGQNIQVLGFRGGSVLLHIVEIHKDAASDDMPVRVTVDSKARDAMSLSSVAARDRDAKADPALRPGNPARRSRQAQDMAVEYDGESGAGVIPRFPVYQKLWSVIRIPLSETGSIALFTATTSGPACKSYVGVFGLPVTPAHMDHWVGDPSLPGAWTNNAAVLEDHFAFIESFGNDTAAMGYWPGVPPSGGNPGGPVTGETKDAGGFSYASGSGVYVYVAIRADETCFFEGRFWPTKVV